MTHGIDPSRPGDSKIFRAIITKLKSLMENWEYDDVPGASKPFDRLKDYIFENEENIPETRWPCCLMYFGQGDMQYAAISGQRGWSPVLMIAIGYLEYTDIDIDVGYEMLEQFDKLIKKYKRLDQPDPTRFKIWSANLTNFDFTIDVAESFLVNWLMLRVEIQLSVCD